VRTTAPGKHNPGVGAKPDDMYALPLCRECHTAQHHWGEAKFWNLLGINPLVTCKQLYQLRHNFTAMVALVETLVWQNKRESGMEIPF
jgi:hypothetical protein